MWTTKTYEKEAVNNKVNNTKVATGYHIKYNLQILGYLGDIRDTFI